jgi:hypothetical protein
MLLEIIFEQLWRRREQEFFDALPSTAQRIACGEGEKGLGLNRSLRAPARTELWREIIS